MVYKWCVVPNCTSTSIKTPEKQFVPVPLDPERRKKWLSVARRNPESIGPNSSVYMCEDHFNMKKDVANYMKVKLGFAKKLLVVDGGLPSKFDCQQDRKRRLSDASTSPDTSLKQRKEQQDFVEECKQENIPHSTESPRTQDKETITNIIEHDKETISDSIVTDQESLLRRHIFSFTHSAVGGKTTMEAACNQNNENLTAPDSSFREKFYRQLIDYDEKHQGSHHKPWTSERISEVINEINEGKETMISRQRRTSMQYYWMKKYDVVKTANGDCLVYNTHEGGKQPRVLPREQYFDVLSDIHESSGHGGRDKILSDIKNMYYIPKKAVEIYIVLCPICETKRKNSKNGIGPRPPQNQSDFNSTAQFDLVDFQSCPDGEFKWLLHYQDNATKFLNLRPLKTNEAVEVASELMKIFSTFGVPYILHSDSDYDFTAKVIKQLVALWPQCKMLHEGPQTHDSSVEKSYQVVENMLRIWMNKKRTTNWSVGCCFVQYFKNTSCHTYGEKSPYKALFGSEPKNGCDVPMSSLFITISKEQSKTFMKQEPAEDMNIDYDGNYDDMENSKDPKIEIESIENSSQSEHSNLTCAVCHTNLTDGALKCESCGYSVDEITLENEGVQKRIKIEVSDGNKPLESPISLRETVASNSPLDVQKVLKCSCTAVVNQCRTYRCACFKKRVLCGPTCHKNMPTCVNKTY